MSAPRVSAAPAPSVAPALSAPRVSSAPLSNFPRVSAAPEASNVTLPATVSTVAAAISSPKLTFPKVSQQTFSRWVSTQKVPTSSTLERELEISTEFNIENWTREIEAVLEKKRAEMPVPQLPTQSFSSAKAKIASMVPAAPLSLPNPPLFQTDPNLTENFLNFPPFFSPYFNFSLFGNYPLSTNQYNPICCPSSPLSLF